MTALLIIVFAINLINLTLNWFLVAVDYCRYLMGLVPDPIDVLCSRLNQDFDLPSSEPIVVHCIDKNAISLFKNSKM